MNKNQIIEKTLRDIGYKPVDCGNHWKMAALYRGGKNPNALSVFKETGVWHDFGNPSGSFPLQALVRATTGKDTAIEGLSSDGEITKSEKEEKIFPPSYLETLLPYLDFYTSRGISRETMNMCMGGYATGSEMFQRITFPIFNRHGQIHGLSGRYIFWEEGEKKVKWKHVGKTKGWVYPVYQPRIKHLIEDGGDIRIVESIGDSVALMQCGDFKHLVSFGLEIKSGLLCYLNSLNFDRVIISFNNDETNRGQIASAKQFIKMCNLFDMEKISIQLPKYNDCMDSFQQEGKISFEDRIDGKDCIAFIKKHLIKPTADEKKFIKKHD